jgi:ABC-type lipoprotein export system ATPase subunit
LLFLQEIISERPSVSRKNPGVPEAQRGKEQRVTMRRSAADAPESLSSDEPTARRRIRAGSEDGHHLTKISICQRKMRFAV